MRKRFQATERASARPATPPEPPATPAVLAVDVVVVGGGPAGAATARHLALAGHRVQLWEAATAPAAKVGEGLPPSAKPLAAELGLLEGLTLHLPSLGTRSSWGAENVEERDFIFSPWGHGWQLDRALFERQLLAAAAEAGVEVRLGCALGRLTGEAGAWRLELPGKSTVTARFLVDATGRAAVVGQRLGGRREHADHLVAFACPFTRDATDPDAMITLEATAHGWWYSAMVPGQPSRRMVVYCTDPRSPTRRSVAQTTGFLHLLATTHLVGPRCLGAGFEPAGAPSGHPAGTSRLQPVGGPGWLAVGDAAMAFDPLSSQGIRSALEGARQAALCIDRELATRESAASAFQEFCEFVWSTYRDRRRQYYQMEQRWPSEPFWALRHQPSYAPQGGAPWRSPKSEFIQPSG